MEQRKVRCYGYDNLRLLLIFCVVFGHMLELIGGRAEAPLQKWLYFLIYSFHIPAFIFLNGHFSRFSWKRVLFLLALYLLFQTVYLCFNRLVLQRPLEIQYEKPYWLLWYLMTLLCYDLLIFILERLPTSVGVPVCAASAVIALAAGFHESIGYEYSLSRTLVFLPFFVMGHFAGRRKKRMQRFFRNHSKLWIWLGTGALGMTAVLHFGGYVTKDMLYGSYSYAAGYGMAERLAIFVTALLWIGAFLSLFLTRLDRPVPFLSELGQNTLPVFLLHGFVVRLLGEWDWIGNSFLLAGIASAVMVAAFGNPFVGSVFRLPRKQIS